MSNNVTTNVMNKVEAGLRSVADPSNKTMINFYKVKDEVMETGNKSKSKAKPKKKVEEKEATSASAAGQFSAPLFSGEEPKKVEATEATSTASSGQYSSPAWVAPNKKNWRGAKKPQYPGGEFVQIKKKCQTFPYCNQGDIKALKIYENEVVKETISNLSKKLKLNETTIKAIIQHELEQKGKL